MRHRLGDDAIDAGLGVNRVPAIQPLHIGNGDLAGSGGAGGIERRESKEGTEFFAEGPRDQSGLAHAQGDGWGLTPGQQFKRFNVVANAPGRPYYFVQAGMDLLHFPDQVVQPVLPPFEVVSADQ